VRGTRPHDLIIGLCAGGARFRISAPARREPARERWPRATPRRLRREFAQWSKPAWSRQRERLLRVHQSFAARFCGALRIAKSVGCAAIMPADTVASRSRWRWRRLKSSGNLKALGAFRAGGDQRAALAWLTRIAAGSRARPVPKRARSDDDHSDDRGLRAAGTGILFAVGIPRRVGRGEDEETSS
jgi:hypothetical protein